MGGFIGGIVQIFYAWQIYTMAKTMFMCCVAALIVVIAVGQSLAVVVSCLLLQASPTPDDDLHLYLYPGFEAWLAGSFVADIFISCSMIWILYRAKKEAVWTRSETLLNRLIVNSIRTGTVTVVCAAIDLALFIALVNGTYCLTPAFILGKLYSNSLMVTLNARNLEVRSEAGQPETFGSSARASTQGGAIVFARSDPIPTVTSSSHATTWTLASEAEATIPNERHISRVVELTVAVTTESDDAVEVKSG
ncbi:hypothetical protein BV25DRAFT_1922215 [Artomyces pyxidatus]|uniref:Uncharacterized protein n=1 Tax=Artomyces pyxidatus TaxID=48021 RepID=A0ACB8SGR7_9AGAM|nr:hypothetical protein BV25DRAFT_1922215 [Artomyces pyxidatus]